MGVGLPTHWTGARWLDWQGGQLCDVEGRVQYHLSAVCPPFTHALLLLLLPLLLPLLLVLLQTTGAKAFKRVQDHEWVGKKGSWSNR